MRIRFRYSGGRALIAMALAGALLFGLRAECLADAASYASDRRQVRACVLVSNASANGTVKENVVPYVFYVMDRRADLKPNGWEFVNPLAPASITGDMYLRWKTRGGATDPAFQAGTPQATVFQIGAPLSKNMGAYWEVDLDSLAADDLQQFDVVLIASRNNGITFTADQRDKLRRFADSGGTIWLEDEGGANISAAGPFITDVAFDVALPAGTPQLNTSHHPLVNFPFSLAAYDAQFLGLGAASLPHKSHRDQVHSQLVDPHYIAPIVLQGGVPLISAGDFGAGHLVISSAGIATGISSFVGGTNVVGGNTGAVSGETMLGVLPSDIKFAYNLVAWTSSVPTHGVNTRRSGGTRENIGSDLGRKWQTAANFGAMPTGDGSGAVIHKGVVFYVDGNNVLHAYDASPEQDLDGDKNADDGIPDQIFGTPFDEIWNVDLKTLGIAATSRVSTPTIVSANASLVNPKPVDVITVTSSNGITLGFDAFSVNASGRLVASPTLLWRVRADTGTDTAPLMVDGHGLKIPGPSPAFSEGILFTVVNDPTNSPNNPWRVAAINPLSGNSVFDNSAINGGVSNTAGVAPTDQYNNVAGLSPVTGPVNVGYVRDLSTGALDKIVYVPTRPFNNGIAAVGGGQVVGCWFATKQEPMTPVDGPPVHFRFQATGERGRVPWFLPNGPISGIDLRPVVYVNRSNGTVQRLTYGVDFTVTYEGSVPNRELIVTLNNGVADEDRVFADYTVDWPDAIIAPVPLAQPNTPQAQEMLRVVSRRFTAPAPVPNTDFLIAGTAMTPEDLMVINSSDFPGFDKVYAVHDQYPASTVGPAARSAKVGWAWGPNGPSDTNNPLDPDSQVGINGYQPRLINSDPWLPEPAGVVKPFAPLVVTDLELIGSPAVSNGVVYEVGFCHMKDGGGLGKVEFNATLILALRSNPPNTFTINQNGTPIKFDTTSTAGQPLVSLEQLDLVNSRPGNPRFIQLFENSNFTVDRISSSVTITDYRSANNGDTFNSALPIYVRIGATRLTDPIVNANTGFGPLDNLLWWTAIPIGQVAAAAIGLQPDAARVAADIQPSCGVTVVGDTLYFGTGGGSLASFDLTGIQNSGGQAKIYRPDGNLRIHTQAAILDPTDKTGTNSIPGNEIISPPLATAGTVVVGTRRGLLALDNQLTLIADNNRLLEVDRAGRAVHSVDSTQAVSIAGGATIVPPDGGQIVNTRIPLDRPSIARRTGLNDYLVSDTGNNRIVQMSHGGLVSWELHTVSNDMHFLRPGDPLTLSTPTDVQTYTDSSLNGALSITNPATGVTYTRGAGYYFATHYIVADSGNFRGLEIVDIVDQTNTPITLSGSDGSTVRMLKQVVFVTKSLGEQNRNIRYRTMQQFTDQNNLTFMVAAVDNLRLGALDPVTRPVGATAADTQGPGAGVMVIKRFPPAGQNDGDIAAVINAFAFLDANGKVAVDANGNILRHSIANPTYFHEFEDAAFDQNGNRTTVQKYLLADASGVYLLRPSNAADQTQGGKALAGSEALVEWMLTSDDYLFLTGRPLRAMSVQRLQEADPFVDPVSGNIAGYKPHYLITNGYSGLDSVGQVFGDNRVLPGELHGEVFEVKSLDYYSHKTNNFYDGYRTPPPGANYRLYAPLGGVLARNPASSIVWMVPNETLPGVDAANNALVKPIKRTIGLTDGGTATYLLEQPTSATRPF
jgi:hypothetical protein